ASRSCPRGCTSRTAARRSSSHSLAARNAVTSAATSQSATQTVRSSARSSHGADAAAADALGSPQRQKAVSRGGGLMIRFAWLTAAVAIAASILVGATAAGTAFPMRIDFPPNPNNGAPWAAEGIFGQANTFWAGDTTNGAVLKGDVRTGESSILVPAAAKGAKAAVGGFLDKWD